MIEDSRRITLVSRDPNAPQREWDNSSASPNRVQFFDSLTVLRYALSNRLLDVDVERVILDRNTPAADYLSLLAELPHAFLGDVILVQEGDKGFLSSVGRGGHRVLYSISEQDLRFYLETNSLITTHSSSSARMAPLHRPHLRSAV